MNKNKSTLVNSNKQSLFCELPVKLNEQGVERNSTNQCLSKKSNLSGINKILSTGLKLKALTVLFLSAIAQNGYAEAEFTLTNSDAVTGVVTGTVDMNGDGVSDGTWHQVLVTC